MLRSLIRILRASLAQIDVEKAEKYAKREQHSVERITSDKGRYPTAQLICIFVVLDLDL